MTTLPAFPPPSLNQPYIHVSAIDTATLELEACKVVKDVPPEEVLRMPSLSFLLRHSSKKGADGELMFDLGMRKECEKADGSVVVRQTAGEALRKGGVDPESVKTIVLSHLHWDHVGLASEFPNATWILGPGTRHLIEKDHHELWILPSSVPPARARILEDDPSISFPISIGPFPKACDYFGDGSLYLINAQGHMTGHLNLLARTSADGSWIYLGGDSAHDVRLLTGEKEMAWTHDTTSGKVLCMHERREDAVEHIERIGSLLGVPKVHVLLAHDWEWFEDNKDGEAFLPGKIPPKLD